MDLGELVELPMASSYRGSLAKGCEECKEGRKMVLFVSGLCRFRCFYCPVSPNRNQRDVTYANERLVHADADILEEARAMGATGTGITGGDPLGVIDRTEHYVRLLRGEFGASHHLHLYTHEPNPEKLRRLAAAGLDEVRLHIPHYLWGSLTGAGDAYRKVLEQAPSWGLRRGVEIPVLPEKEAELRRLLTTLSAMGVEFVNLNELEYSETNATQLDDRGYRVAPGTGWGVDGSRAVAERIVRELRLPMPIHYCSSRFKDGVQLRQRLLRRAERTGPPYAEFTDEGTLVYGIVEVPPGRDLDRAARAIARIVRVRRPAYRVDPRRRRVELPSGELRRVADRIAFPAFEVEEYPTADALEVEREPLNAAAFPRTDGGV
ncbi:MAG TPA: radical SAM protein [Thermoplasmata archaeon]|nr:radical SAM protein [Thermoplasmata archaeon]